MLAMNPKFLIGFSRCCIVPTALACSDSIAINTAAVTYEVIAVFLGVRSTVDDSISSDVFVQLNNKVLIV